MNTKIVLIVGPSGVGKDTLLRHAKEVYKEDLNFVKRYITREADTNEDNYFVDDYAFEVLKNNGYFLSNWNAHGNAYGIPKSFFKNGVNIISISRARIKDFENAYENVYTINITIEKDKLKQRLLDRGRETLEQIEKRLARSYEKIEARKLIEFDNSKPLEESKKSFINLLEKIKNEQT